jgi:hypothetical protein
MHEFLDDRKSRTPFLKDEHLQSIDDVRLTPEDRHAVDSLTPICNALSKTGMLVSLDRSPTVASMWWYTQALEDAGLKVSLSRSFTIEAQSPFGLQKHPLTVARPQVAGLRTTPEEILSLATYRQVSEMGLQLKEAVAEIFLRSLAPTESLFEVSADYHDGSGTRYIVLKKTPTLLILHDFTTKGYQEATVAPLVALPEMLAQCSEMAMALEEHCAVTGALTVAGSVWLTRLDAATT